MKQQRLAEDTAKYRPTEYYTSKLDASQHQVAPSCAVGAIWRIQLNGPTMLAHISTGAYLIQLF